MINEHVEGLVSPKETRDRGCIDSPVPLRGPTMSQFHACIFATRHNQTPGRRDNFLDELGVPSADDQCDVIEDPCVHLDLARESRQCVPVTLDLEAGERAVNHSDIGPYGSLAKPELVENERAVVVVMLSLKLSV